jgi:hypothetical protein
MPSPDVEAAISDSARRLTASSGFTTWRDSESTNAGDVLFVNNSFVFRDVKTNKADAYLALTVNEAGPDAEPSVAAGVRFNSDFKRMAGSSSNLPTRIPIAAAVEVQLTQLGHLVFLLIGEIHDTEIVEADIDHADYSAAVWDPASPDVVRIANRRIIVNRTDDEEAIWSGVEAYYDALGESTPAELRVALGISLDKLQDQAVARVAIPLPGSTPGFGITDAIVAVLREQRDQYALAVERCFTGGPDASAALNDVLRISYNFASDATGFLRLIVSVCDLKPLVLWGTVAEHYALSLAFHALPWSRSKTKPSLKNYQQAIADARNSAFHNLFPFRKSLRVPLPEAALGAPHLQIFSEHSKKTSNQLTYQDKQLVDVLLEFTRARERSLSLTFWQRNLDVMNATIALFERTSEFVKLPASTRAG